MMKLLPLSLAAGLLGAPAFADCRQEPIEAFFKDFSAAIAVQEAVVAPMLVYISIDTEADPEPAKVVRSITAAELEFPLVPALPPFLSAGGSVGYEKGPNGDAVVTLRGGDDGYLMRLVFTAAPCWSLVSIDNQSM